jgi:beta-phosphoglucomutase-like phosphatase (HAD superfamily)
VVESIVKRVVQTRAAKAAGIYCVGYNSIHSKAQDLSEADVIINHFAELNFEKLHLFNPN